MRTLVLLLPLILTPLQAPASCPQGQTASGTCVNPELAKQMRKLVLAQTQAKLSYTAPPRLPSEDGGPGTQPPQAFELGALYTFPAPVRVAPGRGGPGGPIGGGGGGPR
jgi:hypothetical protein